MARPVRGGSGALLTLGLLLAACGGSPTASGSAAPPSSPAPESRSPVPSSPAEGLVVSIDSSGLNQVRGFELRLASGQTVDFTIGVLENGAQFPPSHLQEHRETSSPVRVYFRVEGDRLVVYRIEDAG